MDGSAAVGPVDVSFARSKQFVLMGNPGGGPQTRQQLGPGAAAFDRHGRLHVLEIATNGILSGDFTGRLVRLNRNGSRTVLASQGLFAPGGLAIAHDGSIYVTNNGILAVAGQVLRIPPR